MHDANFDRDFQSARADLNHGIGRLVKATAHAFRRLAAIQFDAPWHNPSAGRP